MDTAVSVSPFVELLGVLRSLVRALPEGERGVALRNTEQELSRLARHVESSAIRVPAAVSMEGMVRSAVEQQFATSAKLSPARPPGTPRLPDIRARRITEASEVASPGTGPWPYSSRVEDRWGDRDTPPPFASVLEPVANSVSLLQEQVRTLTETVEKDRVRSVGLEEELNRAKEALKNQEAQGESAMVQLRRASEGWFEDMSDRIAQWQQRAQMDYKSSDKRLQEDIQALQARLETRLEKGVDQHLRNVDLDIERLKRRSEDEAVSNASAREAMEQAVDRMQRETLLLTNSMKAKMQELHQEQWAENKAAYGGLDVKLFEQSDFIKRQCKAMAEESRASMDELRVEFQAAIESLQRNFASNLHEQSRKTQAVSRRMVMLLVKTDRDIKQATETLEAKMLDVATGMVEELRESHSQRIDDLQAKLVVLPGDIEAVRQEAQEDLNQYINKQRERDEEQDEIVSDKVASAIKTSRRTLDLKLAELQRLQEIRDSAQDEEVTARLNKLQEESERALQDAIRRLEEANQLQGDDHQQQMDMIMNHTISGLTAKVDDVVDTVARMKSTMTFEAEALRAEVAGKCNVQHRLTAELVSQTEQAIAEKMLLWRERIIREVTDYDDQRAVEAKEAMDSKSKVINAHIDELQAEIAKTHSGIAQTKQDFLKFCEEQAQRDHEQDLELERTVGSAVQKAVGQHTRDLTETVNVVKEKQTWHDQHNDTHVRNVVRQAVTEAETGLERKLHFWHNEQGSKLESLEHLVDRSIRSNDQRVTQGLHNLGEEFRELKIWARSFSQQSREMLSTRMESLLAPSGVTLDAAPPAVPPPQR